MHNNSSPMQVDVGLGERSYSIHIGNDVIEKVVEIIAPLIVEKHVMIITDSNVAPLCLDYVAEKLNDIGVRVDAISIPAGEQSKSFDCLHDLLEELIGFRPTRNSLIIALGGGVIGDLAGFSASVLLRGVPFIQIPTTLLAQVDSSVGGKTGINSALGKNLIGSFYQPRAVLADSDILTHLPERELKAGYAEIVKYGMLGDADFFAWLEKNGDDVLALKSDAIHYAVAHSCRMKAQIVSRDEREQGVRALLNLGHTFAHALEAEMGYDGRVLHGEAVSVGMVLAVNLSVKLGYCDATVADRLRIHLASHTLPVSPLDIVAEWNIEALMQHMAHDKKNTQGGITCILLRAIGDAFVQKNVPYDMIELVWQEALGNG